MAYSKVENFNNLLLNEEDEHINAGYRVFEQRGGGRGPLFQAEFDHITVPRRRQRNTAVQMRYNITFPQLRDPGQEKVGEALMEAMISFVNERFRLTTMFS